MDSRNRGILDTASFKAALLRSGIGLNLNDINRLTRYVEKNSSFQIDYVKFVEYLNKVKTDEDIHLMSTSMAHLELEMFNIIKDKLFKYMTDKAVQPGRVIRKIYEKKYGTSSGQKLIPIADFGDFLYDITKPQIRSKEACVNFAKKIDINHDDFIDDTDFNTFLNRSGYIAEAEKEGTRTNFAQTTASNGDLFPKAPLSEERLNAVLRDLRQALTNKNLSYFDFVRMLDTNEVGFITINDFSVGIDKVIQFSQPTKDGLFAYMDKRKIGMVGQDEILKTLNRSVIAPNVVRKY